MMGRLRARPATHGVLARVERPEGVVLVVVLAALAAVGWLGSPLWLAIAVGAQLMLAGLGGVWIIGPARPGMGLARYATLSVAAVSITLFGRVLVDTTGVLLALPAAAALWVMLWAELHAEPANGPSLALDLALVGVVFAAAAGGMHLVPRDAWPPGIVLVLALTLVPAMRAAEARGRGGVEAVGQAALHLVAVGQIGAAVTLLELPEVVAAALLALGYHAWSGAAEALDQGASPWAVILEFGALAVLGMVVALLLHGA
jgi:hypothetical protein